MVSEFIPNGYIGLKWLESINHYNSRGGIRFGSNVHIQACRPDHPRASRDGTIPYHRLVYESFHKCSLLQYTDVHHIDGNPRNNFPNNLEAMTHASHAMIPNPKKSNNGQKHGMYGRHHTEEALNKMRGRKRSLESRKKMSESRRKAYIMGS